MHHQSQTTHHVEQHEETLHSDDDLSDKSWNLHELNAVRASSTLPKFMVTLKINNRELELEVDSGAACSIISEATYRRLWPKNPPTLNQDGLTLHTWSGEGLQVLGTANVHVRHKSKDYILPLVVTRGTGCSLLGRNWFQDLKIRVSGIHHLATKDSVANILKAHEDVFDANIRGHSGPPVNLELKEGATPHFLKSRPVPFALRPAVEAELKSLESQGILEPTQHSEWATPVVVVGRKTGPFDYAVTIEVQ